MCFVGVSALTIAESKAIEAFGILSSLFVTIAVLVVVVRELVRAFPIRLPFVSPVSTGPARNSIKCTLLVVIPLLAVSQFWSIFRLQALQQQMARTAGNADGDDDWTFGQIAAVTVFVPVFVEMWYTWRHGDEE